jgi:hypothetical protein
MTQATIATARSIALGKSNFVAVLRALTIPYAAAWIAKEKLILASLALNRKRGQEIGPGDIAAGVVAECNSSAPLLRTSANSSQPLVSAD